MDDITSDQAAAEMLWAIQEYLNVRADGHKRTGLDRCYCNLCVAATLASDAWSVLHTAPRRMEAAT